MIGNLLEKLFVAVGADISEFRSEMASASVATDKQVGKIGKAWEKLGGLMQPAFKKMGELARIAVSESKEVLAEGMVAALTAGSAAFTAKALDGDIWGALSDGLESAISVGTATLVDGFTDQVLPALLEQIDVMAVVSKAAGGVGKALSGLIPILAGVGKAFMALMISPLGLVVLAIAAVVAAFVYWDDIVEVVKKVGRIISEWYSENVKPTVDRVVDLFLTLNRMALNAFTGIYNGARDFLVDKLGGIFRWLQGKLEAVGGYFFDLYDAVVGNSYIPDMVDGIAEHIGRLEGVMVNPILKATQKSGDAFAELQERVSSLLDGLFPSQAQARVLEGKFEDLDKALAAKMISKKVWREARHRLNRELAALNEEVENQNNPFANDNESLISDEDRADIQSQVDKIVTIFDKDLKEPILDTVARISEGIADMVVDIDNSVRSLAHSFKDGDIVGIIVGVADTISAIANAISGIRGGDSGTGGSGSSKNFFEGRATGGNVRPFATYAVNENGGPEILQMGSKGGRVYNRQETQKMLSNGSANSNGKIEVTLDIDAGEYFDARVAKVAAPGDAAAARQGAIGGHSITVRERRRSSTRGIPGA